MKTMNPWYRERWPWILMSGPAAVVVAGAITTWMAFATADGLVTDDYYKRGLGINAVLKREETAAQRGIEARVERAGGEVRVQLRGAEPPAVFLNLAHATRAGYDVRLRLERGADGSYRAALPPLAAGRWRAVVDDPRGEWRVVQDGLHAAQGDLPATKGAL
jgi:hypothetical protein